MSSFVLLETSPEGDPYWHWLLSGLGWTLARWLAAGVLALGIGIAVGCLRTARSPLLSIPARLYVQLFRNIPLIVRCFLWYFVVPEVLSASWGRAVKQIPPPLARQLSQSKY